jgi:beta-lactamase class A
LSENGKITACRTDRRTALLGIGCSLLVSSSPAAASTAASRLDLSALERRHGGRIGIAVFNSANGRRAAWRSGERFAYCSTFKLFLAAATLQRVAAGKERLVRRIAIRKADMLDHAPVTEKAVGATLPIIDLARAAVEQSDNPAANLLIRELGGLDAWRNWYRGIDDRFTRVDRWELALNAVGPGDPRDTTSPLQTVANLHRLFGARLLTPQHRALLLKWLIDSPRGPNRIKAAAGPGSIVAHKIGTAGSRGHTNDIGLIWPRGAPARTTFVAAYYSGSPLPTLEAREAALATAVRSALGSVGAA